jgi:hypothetical protein
MYHIKCIHDCGKQLYLLGIAVMDKRIELKNNPNELLFWKEKKAEPL